MARTALSIETASDVGASAVRTAPSVDGGIVPPDSITIVRNGTGASITVTAQIPSGVTGFPSGIDPPDRTLAVAAGAEGHIGPFKVEHYGRPVGTADAGQVYLDFSSVAAGVTAFAIRTPGIRIL